MLEDIVDALAVHRLTKLAIDDEIVREPRDLLFKKFPPDSTKLGYLFTCPWCLSVWTAGGVVAARTVAPRFWRPLSYVLAFSSIVGLIEEHS